MGQPMSLPPETRTDPVPSRFGICRKARRGIVESMPKSELMPMKVVVMGLCLSLSSGMACQALAFDTHSGVSRESGPFDLFKFGFFSYKEGRKSDAVEATASLLDKSENGAVYDAIGRRYGIIGLVFNLFSKYVRGGMKNNVGIELKPA